MTTAETSDATAADDNNVSHDDLHDDDDSNNSNSAKRRHVDCSSDPSDDADGDSPRKRCKDYVGTELQHDSSVFLSMNNGTAVAEEEEEEEEDTQRESPIASSFTRLLGKSPTPTSDFEAVASFAPAATEPLELPPTLSATASNTIADCNGDLSVVYSENSAIGNENDHDDYDDEDDDDDDDDVAEEEVEGSDQTPDITTSTETIDEHQDNHTPPKSSSSSSSTWRGCTMFFLLVVTVLIWFHVLVGGMWLLPQEDHALQLHHVNQQMEQLQHDLTEQTVQLERVQHDLEHWKTVATSLEAQKRGWQLECQDHIDLILSLPRSTTFATANQIDPLDSEQYQQQQQQQQQQQPPY